MFLVLLECIGVNKHVIKECSAESIKVGSENIIDEILKCCQGIGKTKWYHQRFKKAILGIEGSFLLLSFCYLDEVIYSSNI
jgi:hypothetical protein